MVQSWPRTVSGQRGETFQGCYIHTVVFFMAFCDCSCKSNCLLSICVKSSLCARTYLSRKLNIVNCEKQYLFLKVLKAAVHNNEPSRSMQSKRWNESQRKGDKAAVEVKTVYNKAMAGLSVPSALLETKQSLSHCVDIIQLGQKVSTLLPLLS